MAKRQITLTHPRQRSVLTDMLPFEAPPTFSNRGFYRFLRDRGIDIEGGQLRWYSDSSGLDLVMSLLFGIKKEAVVVSDTRAEWGRTKTRKLVPIAKCCTTTMPFNFRVAHRIEGRSLSVIHPRNQVLMANFYTDHSALIIYYASLGNFSIRHPVSVSRFAFFKDKLHEQRLETFIVRNRRSRPRI